MDAIPSIDSIRQRLQPALAGQPVYFAYLFGSQATGHLHEESDVDVAIYFDPALTAGQRFDMQSALITPLAESFGVTEDTINVTRLNDAPHLLHLAVLREGILLYEQNEVARIDFELRVLQKEDDEHRYREAYNQEFLRRLSERPV